MRILGCFRRDLRCALGGLRGLGCVLRGLGELWEGFYGCLGCTLGVWGVCCWGAGGGEIFLCVGVPGGAAAPQRWVSTEGR